MTRSSIEPSCGRGCGKGPTLRCLPRPCQGAQGRPPSSAVALVAGASHSLRMTQTTGRFFDELGKLITDAAGAADGVRKEIESVVRAQAENILCELDVVQREEFEAVKAMAQKAREENEQLKQRIALLEEVLDELEDEVAEPPTPRPVRRQSKVKRSY